MKKLIVRALVVLVIAALAATGLAFEIVPTLIVAKPISVKESSWVSNS